MMNLIEEIWIIKSGLVLYHYGKTNMDDSTTIGALLSCIENAISYCFSEDLINIKFKDCILLFHKQGNLLFVGKTNFNYNYNYMDAKNEFNMIISIFNNIYDPNVLKNWSGNTHMFNNLNEIYNSNSILVH